MNVGEDDGVSTVTTEPLNVQMGHIWQPWKDGKLFYTNYLQVLIGLVDQQVLHSLDQQMVLVGDGCLSLYGINI